MNIQPLNPYNDNPPKATRKKTTKTKGEKK